jgi:hypothetical protein
MTEEEIAAVMERMRLKNDKIREQVCVDSDMIGLRLIPILFNRVSAWLLMRMPSWNEPRLSEKRRPNNEQQIVHVKKLIVVFKRISTQRGDTTL